MPSSAQVSITELHGRLSSMLTGGPAVVVGPAPHSPVPTGVGIVVRTSGSTTGLGRPVALSPQALTAGAEATHTRLDGPGRWVLALPPLHIAGLQILVRSAVAQIPPLIALPPSARGFDVELLTRALENAPTDLPLYLSLVPTQLYRMLTTARSASALRRCAAVLIGGAATPPDLRTAAITAGIRAVTTYGMTETCGGCIYDEIPLDGVGAQVDGDGRLWLRGPVLLQGYLDDGPTLERQTDGVRWFQTPDLARLDGDRVHILGRADDVLVTGGVNVHPLAVERALTSLPGEVVVVGVPDPEWGTLVTAIVTERTPLKHIRALTGGGADAPRAVVTLPSLPRLGPGKPDRGRAARQAHRLLVDGQGERL